MQSEPLALEAELLKVLGHPIRLRVLQLLAQGEICVCDLIRVTGVEQSNLSQHLKLLRKHGVVAARRDGTRVLYRVTNPVVLGVVDVAIRAVQQHLEVMAAVAVARQA